MNGLKLFAILLVWAAPGADSQTAGGYFDGLDPYLLHGFQDFETFSPLLWHNLANENSANIQRVENPPLSGKTNEAQNVNAPKSLNKHRLEKAKSQTLNQNGQRLSSQENIQAYQRDFIGNIPPSQSNAHQIRLQDNKNLPQPYPSNGFKNRNYPGQNVHNNNEIYGRHIAGEFDISAYGMPYLLGGDFNDLFFPLSPTFNSLHGDITYSNSRISNRGISTSPRTDTNWPRNHHEPSNVLQYRRPETPPIKNKPNLQRDHSVMHTIQKKNGKSLDNLPFNSEATTYVSDKSNVTNNKVNQSLALALELARKSRNQTDNSKSHMFQQGSTLMVVKPKKAKSTHHLSQTNLDIVRFTKETPIKTVKSHQNQTRKEIKDIFNVDEAFSSSGKQQQDPLLHWVDPGIENHTDIHRKNTIASEGNHINYHHLNPSVISTTNQIQSNSIVGNNINSESSIIENTIAHFQNTSEPLIKFPSLNKTRRENNNALLESQEKVHTVGSSKADRVKVNATLKSNGEFKENKDNVSLLQNGNAHSQPKKNNTIVKYKPSNVDISNANNTLYRRKGILTLSRKVAHDSLDERKSQNQSKENNSKYNKVGKLSHNSIQKTISSNTLNEHGNTIRRDFVSSTTSPQQTITDELDIKHNDSLSNKSYENDALESNNKKRYFPELAEILKVKSQITTYVRQGDEVASTLKYHNEQTALTNTLDKTYDDTKINQNVQNTSTSNRNKTPQQTKKSSRQLITDRKAISNKMKGTQNKLTKNAYKNINQINSTHPDNEVMLRNKTLSSKFRQIQKDTRAEVLTLNKYNEVPYPEPSVLDDKRIDIKYISNSAVTKDSKKNIIANASTDNTFNPTKSYTINLNNRQTSKSKDQSSNQKDKSLILNKTSIMDFTGNTFNIIRMLVNTALQMPRGSTAESVFKKFLTSRKGVVADQLHASEAKGSKHRRQGKPYSEPKTNNTISSKQDEAIFSGTLNKQVPSDKEKSVSMTGLKKKLLKHTTTSDKVMNYTSDSKDLINVQFRVANSDKSDSNDLRNNSDSYSNLDHKNSNSNNSSSSNTKSNTTINSDNSSTNTIINGSTINNDKNLNISIINSSSISDSNFNRNTNKNENAYSQDNNAYQNVNVMNIDNNKKAGLETSPKYTTTNKLISDMDVVLPTTHSPEIITSDPSPQSIGNSTVLTLSDAIASLSKAKSRSNPERNCTIAPLCGSDGRTYVSNCLLPLSVSRACNGSCPCSKQTQTIRQAQDIYLRLKLAIALLRRLASNVKTEPNLTSSQQATYYRHNKPATASLEQGADYLHIQKDSGHRENTSFKKNGQNLHSLESNLSSRSNELDIQAITQNAIPHSNLTQLDIGIVHQNTAKRYDQPLKISSNQEMAYRHGQPPGQMSQETLDNSSTQYQPDSQLSLRNFDNIQYQADSQMSKHNLDNTQYHPDISISHQIGGFQQNQPAATLYDQSANYPNAHSTSEVSQQNLHYTQYQPDAAISHQVTEKLHHEPQHIVSHQRIQYNEKHPASGVSQRNSNTQVQPDGTIYQQTGEYMQSQPLHGTSLQSQNYVHQQHYAGLSLPTTSIRHRRPGDIGTAHQNVIPATEMYGVERGNQQVSMAQEGMSLQAQARCFMSCPSGHDPVCSVKGNTHTNVCIMTCSGEFLMCNGNCPCEFENLPPAVQRTIANTTGLNANSIQEPPEIEPPEHPGLPWRGRGCSCPRGGRQHVCTFSGQTLTRCRARCRNKAVRCAGRCPCPVTATPVIKW